MFFEILQFMKCSSSEILSVPGRFESFVGQENPQQFQYQVDHFDSFPNFKKDKRAIIFNQ